MVEAVLQCKGGEEEEKLEAMLEALGEETCSTGPLRSTLTTMRCRMLRENTRCGCSLQPELGREASDSGPGTQERRGRSTSPAAGRTIAQDDEIAYSGEFGRFSRLYDDEFQIRPWGFLDKRVENKFVEYHWLTFTTNYKGFMTWFWGFVSLLHCLFAFSHMYSDEVLPVTLSLVRCALCSGMAVLFAGRNMVFIRRAYQCITLGYFLCIMPVFFTLEFINPHTTQMKVTVVVIVSTIAGFLFMPCSWISMCWVYCTAFWVPAVIIFQRTWEEQDHDKMVERAGMLCFAGIAGPFFGALFSVDYRRRWALASWGESRRSQKKLARELKRRSSFLGRSQSPMPRLAEEKGEEFRVL